MSIGYMTGPSQVTIQGCFHTEAEIIHRIVLNTLLLLTNGDSAYTMAAYIFSLNSVLLSYDNVSMSIHLYARLIILQCTINYSSASWECDCCFILGLDRLSWLLACVPILLRHLSADLGTIIDRQPVYVCLSKQAKFSSKQQYTGPTIEICRLCNFDTMYEYCSKGSIPGMVYADRKARLPTCYLLCIR